MGLFVRPFRVKSNTQMKGSDKKKLKAQLKTCFPELTDDDLNLLIPNKDEIITSKVYTYGGESVLLYISNRDCVFFQLEKDKTFFPTVYTLWKHPKLLPVFTTFVPVMAKIANGADLMLPGIITDESKGIKAYCEGLLEKGDLVSINLTNNIAPIAVGRTHRSSEDMYMAVGRGKGVDIIHSYGDQLWTAGSRVEVPSLGVPSLPHQQKEYVDNDEEDEEDDDEVAKEEEELASLSSKLEAAKISQKEPEKEEPEDTRDPVVVMDELMDNAFYQSWKTTAKKIEFPILTSNYFRLHMVKSAPPGVVLDPKKSSYKKLTKFLANKERHGMIKIKELQKGVESIMAVDLEHENIKYFRPVKYAKVEEDKPEENILPCDKEYCPPRIVELRTVNSNVSKLFANFKIIKGRGMTGAEVRDIIVKYVKENGLQDPVHKSIVKLDPILAEIVLVKGENHVVEMKWDDLSTRVQDRMSDGYSLQFPGQPAEVRKGKLDPVELTTASRSGNKKITLIYNLETYGIDPQEFAHKCQVGVAASTAVNPAVNRKSGNEVLIQGNQIAFATNLLLEYYKIPRKYIKGTEQAPKPKKKKK